MGFSRQEYWNGLPFPSPEDLLYPGIIPLSPMSPALAGRFFTTEPPGKPNISLKKTALLEEELNCFKWENKSGLGIQEQQISNSKVIFPAGISIKLFKLITLKYIH